MTQSLTITLTGTTDLPPGKIATIVTSLEMFARPPVRPDPSGMDGFSLEQMGRSEIERYLTVYRLLGERWMWFSRLTKPRAELDAVFADPAIAVYAVRYEGRDVGLLELDVRVPGRANSPFSGWTSPWWARAPAAG